METPITLTKKVFNTAKDLYIFSKLERIIAAVCMGTPFFLILADSFEKIKFWQLAFGIAIIMLVPLVISVAAYRVKKMTTGKGILTLSVIFMFVGLLFFGWFKILPDGFWIRDSISAYVAMSNAQTFGLLLTTASMLFIFNGAVYIHKGTVAAAKEHSKWYNLVLGCFLLCVVLFPCTNSELAVWHYICAAVFFFGSALVTAFFNDKQHRKISLFIAGVMVLGFVFHFANMLIPSKPFQFITLFWAETIGLWVIGVHYILESLGDLT